MKKIKRGIAYLTLCLLLTAMAPVSAKAQEVSIPEISTTVTYTVTGVAAEVEGTTTVDKGVPKAGVKTGDSSQAGSWFILLIVSALFIAMILIIKEKQEREDNRF